MNKQIQFINYGELYEMCEALGMDRACEMQRIEK